MNLAGPWRYRADDSPDFKQPEFDDSTWETMHLPRNWFLGGLDRQGVVWFRTWFKGRFDPTRFQTLHLEGVDYFADVYLNGVPLGQHTGYFEPFSFDITHVLKPGRNLLVVRVDSPYEKPGLDGWFLRKKLIKGVLNHHDCRPGGGWDPAGQSYNTGGIWNRIHIEEHGPLTIERVLLRAELEAQPPRLHAQLTLRNRAGHMRRRIELRCAPENFKGRVFEAKLTLDIPAGDSLHQLQLPVPQVSWWNPWDRGAPNLYTVSFALGPATYSSLFGFRTVRVSEDYKWFINGERYFLRGSNYIASQWLSEMLFEEVAKDSLHPFGGGPGGSLFNRDVTLARQANLNILRVHAHVMPPEFHQACDRAGLLVWQDFPFQWGYSDEPAFQEEAERQMQAMLSLLYNHPCIVAWCCHNESPWNSPWMAARAGGPPDPSHNQELDARLEKVVKDLDPTRYVHRNSGSGDGHVYPGWYFGHWREYKNIPGAPFVTEYGAQGLPVKGNLLRTFASLGPEAGYSELVRFKAWLDSIKPISASRKALINFGTLLFNRIERTPALKPLLDWMKGWGINVERSTYHTLPPLEETPPELRPARRAWEAWRFHNFQPAETFDRGIDLGSSLEEFIANSQAYQSNLLQFATEYYRWNKYSKVNGILQFYFTDPWPAVTWSVLDYWRVPKPSFETLRRSMQPVLPSFQLPDVFEAGKAAPSLFCVVNDLKQAFPQARCEWRLGNLNGEIASATFPVDIPADGISTARTVTLTSLLPGRYSLRVFLTTTDGQPLGENTYEIQVGGRAEESLTNPSTASLRGERP